MKIPAKLQLRIWRFRMKLTTSQLKKVRHECIICGKFADTNDEIVFTKRHDILLFHRECYDKEQEDIRTCLSIQ